MTQVMTIDEYILFELNRRARARGDDVELVFEHPERPRPRLAAKDGEVVEFAERPKGTESKG
jgi:hypothetical protein